MEKYDVEWIVLLSHGLRVHDTAAVALDGNGETLALSVCDVVRPSVGAST